MNQDNNTKIESEEEKINKYRDFLPENRLKNETNVSPKVMKTGLVFFYLIILVGIVIFAMWFNGDSKFRAKKRIYNLNLAESINLDTIYKDEKREIEWLSDSDNVVIENNVVTAVKSGKAYIYAKEGNKQVSDVTLNILNGTEAITLDKHSYQAKIGEEFTINSTQNWDTYYNEDNEKTPKEKLVEFVKKIYEIITQFTNKGKSDSSVDSNNQNNNNITQDDNNTNNQNNNNTYPSDNNTTNNSIIPPNNNAILPNDNTNIQDAHQDFINDDVLMDEHGDYDDNLQDIVYKSNNEKIVKVDETGKVTPVSPGEAKISVIDQKGNSDYITVKVEEEELIIYNTEYTVFSNSKFSIEYFLNSTIHTNSDIKWKSNNFEVAKVDNVGNVITGKTGIATITATVGKIKKEIYLTVKENIILPQDINISTTNIILETGTYRDIVANVVPSNATNQNLSWESENQNIATVTNGKVVAKSEGTTKIIVTSSNGIKKEIGVIVNKKKVPVERIIVSKETIKLIVGGSEKLAYSLYPKDATDSTVSILYDKNYISINGDNSITALKEGTTKLTIQTNDGKTAEVNVIINVPVQQNIITTPEISKDESFKITGIELNLKNYTLDQIGTYTGKALKYYTFSNIPVIVPLKKIYEKDGNLTYEDFTDEELKNYIQKFQAYNDIVTKNANKYWPAPFKAQVSGSLERIIYFYYQKYDKTSKEYKVPWAGLTVSQKMFYIDAVSPSKYKISSLSEENNQPDKDVLWYVKAFTHEAGHIWDKASKPRYSTEQKEWLNIADQIYNEKNSELMGISMTANKNVEWFARCVDQYIYYPDTRLVNIKVTFRGKKTNMKNVMATILNERKDK